MLFHAFQKLAIHGLWPSTLAPRQKDLHAAERELDSLHAQLGEAPAKNWGHVMGMEGIAELQHENHGTLKILKNPKTCNSYPFGL